MAENQVSFEDQQGGGGTGGTPKSGFPVEVDEDQQGGGGTGGTPKSGFPVMG